MAGSKVVARYRDGRMMKGITSDFLPARDVFHVAPEDGSPPVTVRHAELKAIFFVRDYAGDASHQPTNEFDESKPIHGRKLRVEFDDGEVIVGTTQGYQPGRAAFFVIPADESSNAQRCFVFAAATKSVDWV
ncbi:MAG: hypothetical protein R2862_01545 [Thermoanaerobaculia bacterium]